MLIELKHDHDGRARKFEQSMNPSKDAHLTSPPPEQEDEAGEEKNHFNEKFCILLIDISTRKTI